MDNLGKQKAIIQSTLELIEEKGDIGAVTISKIANKANIGKGTVYEYFSCKEEIFVEAMIYCIDSIKTNIESLPKGNGSLEDDFSIFYNYAIDFWKNNRIPFYLTFLAPTIENVATNYLQRIETAKQNLFLALQKVGSIFVLKAINEGRVNSSITKEEIEFAFFSVFGMVFYKASKGRKFTPIKTMCIKGDLEEIDNELEQTSFNRLLYLLNISKR